MLLEANLLTLRYERILTYIPASYLKILESYSDSYVEVAFLFLLSKEYCSKKGKGNGQLALRVLMTEFYNAPCLRLL